LYALPFCHLQIKVLHRQAPDNWITTQTCVTNPKTLGEHLRKRRLELHLLQGQVAKRLGVHKMSIQNWELGLGKPKNKHIPAIVQFLGYKPIPIPEAFPKQLVYYRCMLGMTQEELAEVLKVNSCSIGRWETGKGLPQAQTMAAIQTLLKSL
jgi:transcriptional regulator with XRE-family HTH domain